MAKKQSRSKRKDRKVRLSAAQMEKPDMEKAASAGPAAPAPDAAGLREEYDYVAGDLRRALVLGAIILAILAGAALLLS